MGREEKAFERFSFLLPHIVTNSSTGSQIFIQWPDLLRGQWLSALLGVGGCCSKGPEQGSPPRESLTALSEAFFPWTEEGHSVLRCSIAVSIA